MTKKQKDTNGLIMELMEFLKKQFEIIYKRFDAQEKILESSAEDIRDLREGQLLHDRRFDELESAVRGISRAVDKDAVKVIDQGRRLTRFELRSRR